MSLAEFIRQRREELGLSSSQLADQSSLSRSELSSIEHGRIRLPRPSKRRELAHALGVRHIDLLIAAGELDEDEIPVEGATREPFAAGDPRRDLLALVEQVQWKEERLVIVNEILHRMRALDEGKDARELMHAVTPMS